MENVNRGPMAQKSNHQQRGETSGLQREVEDLFSNGNGSQNPDAASILAALVCLTVGSGVEEV